MKYSLSTLVLLGVLSAHGQILRVSKGSLDSDSSNYFIGAVDATFALNNRSSTQEKENLYLGINNNLDIVYIGEQSATIWISGINYYKLGDGPLIFNGTAHLREVFKRSAILTPEVFVQAQFDESRNMEFRGLLGGGYRWHILNRKNSFYTGLGVFREYERWQGEEALIEVQFWKLNYYLSADVRLTESITVNAIVYYQTGRDETINAFRNRVSGQFEFKNAVSDRFKVKLTSNFLLDDHPIIPLNRWIYEAFFGIEYGFN